MSSTKNNKDQKLKKEHVKKHDHSILGKHNKKEKKAYIESLKQQDNTPQESNAATDNASAPQDTK